ncbi:MAG TPA: hypothetical protein VFU43_27535 [Streptosporangiaceae bacterium]|nr:hypothetical protein [Streptosporangiaceae bacterium]
MILQPTADDPDPEGFVRFVAADVRPLVRWSVIIVWGSNLGLVMLPANIH